MRTIYKYALNSAGTTAMPRNAKILTVQVQRGQPCLWAEVESEDINVIRHFSIFGTGHKIPDGFDGDYIGTFQLEDCDLVFHVYEGEA